MSASPWETLPPPAAEAPRAGAGLTPAGWWNRVGATIADNLLIAIPTWIVIGVAGIAAFGSLGGNAIIALVGLVYAVLMLTYHHGQTIGKGSTSIRVLAEDNEPVGAGRALGQGPREAPVPRGGHGAGRRRARVRARAAEGGLRVHGHHLSDRRPLAALAVGEPRAPRPRRGHARREHRRRPAAAGLLHRGRRRHVPGVAAGRRAGLASADGGSPRQARRADRGGL